MLVFPLLEGKNRKKMKNKRDEAIYHLCALTVGYYWVSACVLERVNRKSNSESASAR